MKSFWELGYDGMTRDERDNIKRLRINSISGESMKQYIAFYHLRARTRTRTDETVQLLLCPLMPQAELKVS